MRLRPRRLKERGQCTEVGVVIDVNLDTHPKVAGRSRRGDFKYMV